MSAPVVLSRSDRGEGSPALVFLHYYAGSARAWNAVVAELAPTYRCIAADLRGFGRSPAPPDGYTVADSADDVAALLAPLALDRYVLVGHSMGGKIAMALAARRPPGLAALVLVAPSPPTPEPMSDKSRAESLAHFGDREAAIATAHRITVRPLAPPVFEQVVEDSLRTARPAWDAWLLEGSRENIADAMPGVQVPTLIVAGGQDPVMHQPMLEREVRDRIAGARMVVVPDVGHLSPLEAPEPVTACIREQCQALTRATPGIAAP